MTALCELSVVDPTVIQCPFRFCPLLHAEAPVHRDPADLALLIGLGLRPK